ncbi:MAG: hypothetical protein FWC13_08880 [Oscillospiraceae bacterium]|nr:hypothetical protein [Oscillospiraceae bacterium]
MTRYECGGVPYFIENGLPYPTAFFEQDHPRLNLNGTYHMPDLDKTIEIPGCFNKIGDFLEHFEGILPLEHKFVFSGEKSRGIRRLCLEGFFHNAEIWLNGTRLGQSCDPHLPTYFNVTDILKYGDENTLRIEIDNRISPYTLPPRQFEGHKPGWKLYAGVFRELYIESLPEVYCFKADVRTSGDEVISNLLFADAEGNVSHAKYSQIVENPERWSPESPHLHVFKIETPFGSQSVRFGFRDIAIAEREIQIDGQALKIKGVCRHEEHYDHGHALPKEITRQELFLIKDLGGNLARLAHYPHREDAYDVSDETGLLVYAEVANYQAGLGLVQGLFGKSAELRKNKQGLRGLWRLLRSSRQLTDPKYLDSVKRSLIKLIERERNHPSVLFWGVGNECFSITRKSKKALLELKQLVTELDSTRPAAYAAFTAPGITPRFEKSLEVFDVICVNEYYGWYYGSADDAKEYWEKIAKRFPGKPLLLTETGSDAYLSDSKSLEKQCDLLQSHWKLVEKNLLSGVCVWLLKDFACPEYGEDLPVPGHNAKGLYTKEYKEKPAADMLRGLWWDEG